MKSCECWKLFLLPLPRTSNIKWKLKDQVLGSDNPHNRFVIEWKRHEEEDREMKDKIKYKLNKIPCNLAFII